MVYYNAYITGEYNALYTPTNQGIFHCSFGVTNIFMRGEGSDIILSFQSSKFEDRYISAWERSL